MWKWSSVEPLVVHELPDSAHPCVAASAGGGVFLEAMSAFGEGVQIALDTHAPELTVYLGGTVWGIGIQAALNHAHRAGFGVESQFRDDFYVRSDTSS
jgi:hypothetical protein